MKAIPRNLRKHRQSPTFTDKTLSEKFKQSHRKNGVWSRIIVTKGELEYKDQSDNKSYVLTKFQEGVIAPTEDPDLTAKGEAEFYVVYYE